MIYSLDQQRAAYKKLPPEVQDLITDNETTEIISNILKEAGFNDEQANLADSEILWAMYCLQSLDDSIKNIAALGGKSITEFEKLKSTLQDNVFSKYQINIEEAIASNRGAASSKQEGGSLPMVEEGERAHEVPRVDVAPQPATPAQAAAPAQPEPKVKTPLPDYRYPDGADPYREPLK